MKVQWRLNTSLSLFQASLTPIATKKGPQCATLLWMNCGRLRPRTLVNKHWFTKIKKCPVRIHLQKVGSWMSFKRLPFERKSCSQISAYIIHLNTENNLWIFPMLLIYFSKFIVVTIQIALYSTVFLTAVGCPRRDIYTHPTPSVPIPTKCHQSFVLPTKKACPKRAPKKQA